MIKLSDQFNSVSFLDKVQIGKLNFYPINFDLKEMPKNLKSLDELFDLGLLKVTELSDEGVVSRVEVYNDSEYTKLKDKVLLNWNVFKNVIPDHNATVVDDEVSFGVEDEPDETIIKEIHAEMESGQNHISIMIDD